MSVAVGADGGSDIEARGVVFQVCVEEIGVDGVDDVAGDEEGVGICAAEGALLAVELLDDALHDAGQEVAACALAEERADFFVVEEGDHADLRGVGDGGGGVDERLDGSP